MKRKFFFYFLCLSILFHGCKKENDRPQWDIDVLGPVLFASLTLNELMADTLRQVNADSSVSLMLEQSFYNLETDSIYSIPDTNIANIIVWPIIPTNIDPATPFLSQDNTIALGVSGVKLSKAIMEHGAIHIELRNTLPTKVIYTYTIPKAKKSGTSFSLVREVEAATTNGPGFYSGSFDLDGYEIDLTGPTGNQFNTITYNVNALSDPDGVAFTIFNNDTVINIKTRLTNLEPIYVKGYLGTNSMNERSTIQTGLANLIYAGFISLDQVTMDIDIENYIGADAQIMFNSLLAINSRTSSSVILNAPTLMSRTLNINRAQESGAAISPPLVSKHTYHLDNSNSNLKAFIENLPERISYDVDLKLNPLGNISFYNDFLYSDKLVNGKLAINMPLRFAAQNLLLADTQELALDGLTDLDPLRPLTLTLLAENGFPVDFDVQLFVINENHVVIDSLLIPGFIRMANLDAQYKVTSPNQTKIEITVDGSRKERLLQGKFMGIRTTFQTPDYPQKIQLYSSHRLDLKLIANGTYYIR
jgi:hypothetical protein